MRIVSLLSLFIGTFFLFLYAFRINLESWNNLGLGLFFWILSGLIAAVSAEPYIVRRQPSQNA